MLIRRNMNAVAQFRAEVALAEARAARAEDFADEADPLFFKVQRGEADPAEYTAKIAEIRARHPYPEEQK